MIILIMMKLKYLATFPNVGTHLPFINWIMCLLKMTFNIYVKPIYNPIKWKSPRLSCSCQFVQYLLVYFFWGGGGGNPEVIIIWEDQFCDMLDNIVSLFKEYLLLRDFNIDLMFPKYRWN